MESPSTPARTCTPPAASSTSSSPVSPPFQGDSAVAIAYQHVREIPKRPSSLAADVPESLDRVILKSLAKSREDRYQDRRHMRADLQAAARGMSVAAPAADSWSPATSVMASPAAEPVQPTSAFAQVPSGSSPMQAPRRPRSPRRSPRATPGSGSSCSCCS